MVPTGRGTIVCWVCLTEVWWEGELWTRRDDLSPSDLTPVWVIVIAGENVGREGRGGEQGGGGGGGEQGGGERGEMEVYVCLASQLSCLSSSVGRASL